MDMIRPASRMPHLKHLRYKAKGDCVKCYNKKNRYTHGTRPATFQRRQDFIEDYMFLWEDGYRDDVEIARRMGMKLDSMQTKRRRAIKAGHDIPWKPRHPSACVGVTNA